MAISAEKKIIDAAESAVLGEASDAAASEITVQLEGTWTATIQFEARVPGGSTWTAVEATPIGGGAAVTSTTANGTWRIDSAGLEIRLRASSFTSGSVDIFHKPTVG